MTEIIIPILIIGIFFVVLYFVCAALNSRYSSKFDPDGGFTEPETDAVFEEDEPPLVMVESDTAGRLLPPVEVMLFVYRWNRATSRYDYLGKRSLSEWPFPEVGKLNTAPSVIWNHNEVFPAPVPLDCALGASPLPIQGLN